MSTTLTRRRLMQSLVAALAPAAIGTRARAQSASNAGAAEPLSPSVLPRGIR